MNRWWTFSLLAWVTACDSPLDPDPSLPDIVVVTLDTTRADHLGCYGYFRPTSLVLDRFADRSLRFTRCVVPMATTLPTHTSLFTATHPLEHRVLANVEHGGHLFTPTPRLRSFASACQDVGYSTAAFVSAIPVDRGTGMERGFDTFEGPDGAWQRAETTIGAATDWLEDRGPDPFLLWVHLYDPHYPLDPPPPYDSMFRTGELLEAWLEERRVPKEAPRPILGIRSDTREAINAYDGEIRYMDAWLGQLLLALAARPRWDETAVVIMGDHGEGLGQHRHMAHGGVWGEQLRVPLLVRAPGTEPGVVDRLMSAMDVLPTLVGMLGIEALSYFVEQGSGVDVFGERRESAVLSQETGRTLGEEGYRMSLTRDTFKLVRTLEAGGEVDLRLYDLEADPHELVNVSGNHPQVVQKMQQELDAQIERYAERADRIWLGHEPEPGESLSEERRAQLEALGYLEPESPVGE